MSLLHVQSVLFEDKVIRTYELHSGCDRALVEEILPYTQTKRRVEVTPEVELFQYI